MSTQEQIDAARAAIADSQSTIARLVLSGEAELTLPSVQESLQRLADIPGEIEAASARKADLDAKTAAYKELDQRVNNCRSAVQPALNKLAQFTGQLGRAAWAAHTAGELPDSELWASRKAIDTKVAAFKTKMGELDKVTGFFAKAKATAEKLAIQAQVAMAEGDIGKTETAIGRTLINESREAEVQCDGTAEIIASITEVREEMGAAGAALEAVETEQREMQAALAEDLGVATVAAASMIESKARESFNAISQLEQEKGRLEGGIADQVEGSLDPATLPDAHPLKGTLARLAEARATLGEQLQIQTADKELKVSIEHAHDHFNKVDVYTCSLMPSGWGHNEALLLGGFVKAPRGMFKKSRDDDDRLRGQWGSHLMDSKIHATIDKLEIRLEKRAEGMSLSLVMRLTDDSWWFINRQRGAKSLVMLLGMESSVEGKGSIWDGSRPQANFSGGEKLEFTAIGGSRTVIAHDLLWETLYYELTPDQVRKLAKAENTLLYRVLGKSWQDAAWPDARDLAGRAAYFLREHADDVAEIEAQMAAGKVLSTSVEMDDASEDEEASSGDATAAALEKMESTIQNMMGSQGSSESAAPAPAAPAGGGDTMEKLKKLKELLDMGVLTQEEFDAKKGELLAQL